MSDDLHISKIYESLQLVNGGLGELKGTLAAMQSDMDRGRTTNQANQKEMRDNQIAMQGQLDHLHVCVERQKWNWKLLVTVGGAAGSAVASLVIMCKDKIIGFFS